MTPAARLPDLAPVGLVLEGPSALTRPNSVVGSASILGDGTYQLTSGYFQAGAAWGQADLSQNFTLDAKVDFGTSYYNSVGVSFALQNVGADALGSFASLGSLVPGSFGIDLDSLAYFNYQDTLQFVANGYVGDTSFDVPHPLGNYMDGLLHDVVINWLAATSTLSVSIDGTAIASKSFDAVNQLFGGGTKVYYGFGGGTYFNSPVTSVSLPDSDFKTPIDYFSVAHQAAAGTIVGDLVGVDPNIGDTLTYTIVDANGQAVLDPIFEIVGGNQIAVKADAVYDDASVTSHNLNILVTDAAGATYQTAISIDYDVPNAPPATNTPKLKTILGSTGEDTIFAADGGVTVDGGYGNDTIAGGSGDDTLMGGFGDDVIAGGRGPALLWGNDTFNGGRGNDMLSGGRGDDTFLFNRGDGNDIIAEAGGSNRIVFGPGIAASDIAITQANGTDIVLTLDDGGGSITIKNVLSGDVSATIQRLEFADGTQLPWSDIVAQSQQGGAGDDTLQAIQLPTADSLANLIYNGSFEKFTGGTQTYYGPLTTQSVPGWTSGDGHPLVVATAQSNYLQPSDGTYWLDLGYDAPSVVSQEIDGLTSGQTLLLTFDHAGYAPFNVLWNGQVVDTIDSSSYAMITEHVVLDAQQGANSLQFAIAGSTYQNSAIDNVKLYGYGAKAPVYGDGTPYRAGDFLLPALPQQPGVLYTAVEASAVASAANLVVNGDFQTPDPAQPDVFSNGTTVLTSNVPGWVDANGTAFQIESSGQSGSDTQWLDLENTDAQAGMDISQTVGNLSSGQSILLQFDHAGPAYDSAFDVYWNGQLVAEVNGSYAGTFQTERYLLAAQDGDNVLRFASSTGFGGGITPLFEGGYSGGHAELTNVSLQAVDGSALTAIDDTGPTFAAVAPLVGGDGNDTLLGSPGNDTISGGKGDDLLEGGAGDDTYSFNLGDGQDKIVDFQGSNKLVFGAGIAASDLRMLKDGTKVTLAIAGTGDEVTIGTIPLPPGSSVALAGTAPQLSIQEVDFADGTIWTSQTLAAMELAPSGSSHIVQGDNLGDALSGGIGDATVIGGSGNDTLTAGPGNDLLEGGQGQDTYVFGRSGGQAIISDAGGYDTLQFDASVTPDDIDVRESSDGLNLVYSIHGTSDRIEVENAWGTGRIENVQFADGTSWSTQDILDHLATPGDDVIYGGGYSFQTLAGGPGNDYLNSGGGYYTTYVFNPGDGQDTIHGGSGTSYITSDTLDISGYTKDEISFSRVAVGSHDVLVTFANSTDSIIIENEFGSGAVNVDLMSDGTVFHEDDIRTAVLASESTPGDDTIVGSDAGNETIDAGRGNDLILAGSANETFVYRQGDGDDRIVLVGSNDPYGYGTKVLKLLDYNASDVTSVDRASAGSNDLVVSFKTSGDRITLATSGNSYYYNYNNNNFTIEFADGTVWTRDDVRQQVVNYEDTNGNNVVDGNFQYSYLGLTFNAKPGDDRMIGAGYGDTFVLAKGDGNDVVEEDNRSGYGNTLQFVGINSTDVSAAWEYKGSSNVVLTYSGDASDSVEILNALSDDGSGIQAYQFADGVTFDKTKLRSLLSNAAPVAADDGYFSAVAGQATTISVATLLSNDYDPNGDSVRIVSVDGGTDGAAALDGNGNVVFTAASGFTGATTFKYTITDGNGGFATASVEVRVRPPASAVDDSGFSVAEDSSITITAARLLSNDPGGEYNVIGQVFDPQHGTVTLSSDGTILFTPDANYRGPAQFSYIGNTPDGGAATAHVYIDVTPVDHAPVVVNDGPFQTNENQALTITSAHLLANDSDVDGNPFKLTAVTSSADLKVVLNADGTITATPRDYFYGSTYFQYTATGPSGLSSTATVAVDVAKHNTPPVAVADLISTYHDAPILENSPIVVDARQLLANDYDHEGDTLTLTAIDHAVGGTATLLANSTVLFTPNANFSGNASFDYTISDGSGGVSTATATLVYQPVNQQPIAQNDTYNSRDPELQRALLGAENTPLSISITELLKNDFDIENDTITFQSAGNADHGKLTFSGDPATALDAGGNVALSPYSTITYTPDAGYYGDAFFSYVVSDPQGAIGAGRVTVRFAPDSADAPPIANPDSFSLYEDIPLTIDISTLLANDASADGGPLTFVGWAPIPVRPLDGTIKTNDAGDLVFTPDLNWFGDTAFDYTIADDHGHTATAEVDLHIINVPHDPTAVDLDGFVTPLDVPLVIPVAGILKQDYSVDYFSGPEQWIQPDPNLRFVGVDAVDQGTASVVTANTGEQYIVVTPTAGYTGPIKITYRIADYTGLQGIGFLTATVESSYSGELDGTPGDDLLIGNGTNEIIRTLDGNDTVLTGDGNNIVYLGKGADTVTTGAGNDVIYAGSGKSAISTGAGDDTIYESASVDMIDGGTGFNTVDYSASHTGVNVDLAARIGRLGDAQGDIYRNIQRVVGSKYGDTLRADDSGDTLVGGDGNDTLIGGAGADTLLGGAGDDTLVGSAGADVVDGGAGVNSVDYSGSTAAVEVDLTAGTASGGYADGDVLSGIQNVTGSRFDDVLIGDEKDNVLVGGAGNDVLRGGAGNDTLIGGTGADILDGGDGIDTVDYSGSSAGVTINLQTGTASGGDADGDTLTGIENLVGSYFDDVLIGGAEDNVFTGGAGADTLDGGGGFNTASYATSRAPVTVDLATGLGSGGDADGDILRNIQEVVGSNYNDTLIGSGGDDTLRGGIGNDTLMGGAGSDTYLFGLGDGADTIVEQESSADVNRVVLDAGITVHDVSVERIGNDMKLVFENQGSFLTDSISVKDQFLDADSGIQQLVFSDGQIWDRATLAQRSLEGVLNAQDDIVYGVEETTSVIDPTTLFKNDVTGSPDGLVLQSVQGAVNGTVAIDSDGKIEFNGNPFYHGDAYFTYTVADAYGRISSARVDVQLASTNHPPVAIDHTGLTGNENTVIKIPFSVLLQGATDAENDPLTVIDGAPLIDGNGNPIASYSKPSYFAGTNVAGLLANNAVLGDYVELDLRPDYYGFAGFRYAVSDGNGGTTWANEEIYINHVNQAPRAGDQDNVEKFDIRLGKTDTLDLSQVLASAYDPEGDAFHFVGVHDAVGGAVGYDPTLKAISFTPKALGPASFQFDLADVYNATGTVTVDLNVIPEFDPPIAHDDGGFVTLENQALVIDPAQLLANDVDPNGDTLVLQGVSRFAKDGFVSIDATGKIVFVPRTNYNGPASFTYQVTDSHGGVSQATVSLTVAPVDQGATLHDDLVQDVQDKPLTILAAEAFGNDVDPLGNVLFFGTATALGQLTVKYLSKDVQFSALTVRGHALPSWLGFDAATMTFSGIVPDGMTAPLNVEVKTFDPDNGNSFVHYFSFGPSDAVDLAAGISVKNAVMAGYVIRSDVSESFDYGLTGVGKTVSVGVTLADGTALPSWLAFDPATQTLVGGAPDGTKPFAVLATFSYLDPTSGAMLTLQRDIVVDPATVGARIALNTHVAALALSAGTWTAHTAGNQPLPEWLDFDPATHLLGFSGYAPAADATPARIDVDFAPTPTALANGTYASSHGGFTLEFVVDPTKSLDPAINAILANKAYFAQQNAFGIDLSRAVSITASMSDGNPLPDWLHFDAATLQFSGSPPPEYVGAVPVRLDVVGDGVATPSFSILTDVVVDSTFQAQPQFGLSASVAPEQVTLSSPIAHDNGSIAVQYTSVDEKGTASVNSAIDVVDIAPRLVPIRAGDDASWLVQGHSTSFTLDDLLANDRDDNGDSFRVTQISQPQHGSLVVTGAHYDLAPPAGLATTATSSISATLADGSPLPTWMKLDPATGAISADPGTAVLGSYTVAYTLTDGTATRTAQATYAIDGNQGVSFVYTPDPAFVGDDGFTYTVTDDKQTPVTANVALHVAPALVANGDAFATPSDHPLTIGIGSLLANDVSADGRPLTVTAVSQPAVGSLTFDGTDIVYTSTHYYDGKDSFQYTVADDEGHSQQATVTLGVTSIDHAPSAPAILLAGQENAPVTISTADILSHVADADGEAVTLVSVTANGGTPARALVLPDGNFQFVPNANTYGDMAFSYTVTDGYKSSTGAFDVAFARVPLAPVANTDGVYQDNQDTPIRLSLDSLLANDVDPDGTPLSITNVYRGVNGSVAFDGSAAVFTPRDGYYGTASFNYTLTDGEGQQSEGLVKFLILPTYHPPVAVSDSGLSMLQDTTLDIDPAQLLANDIDPDGKGLTFVGFTDGPVTKLDNGLYRVTPAFNFLGPLTLTYAITNDSNVVVTTTATIDVQHVEHAPNAVDDHFSMTEDQPLVLQEKELLANDYDLDNNAIGLTGIVGTNHVSVAVDYATGQIEVTPDQHYSGPASFDYQITDSTGRTGTARANLDVAFVYYPPTIADIAPLAATEERAFSIALPSGLVTDIENYPLLVTLQAPGGGALPNWLHFDSASLTLSGTPPTGVYGDIGLELRADDGTGVATKDFTLSVAHVNHNPTIDAAASVSTGSLAELPGTTGSTAQDVASGAIAFSDVDKSDTHGASVTGVSVSGNGAGLPDAAALRGLLSFGSATEPSVGSSGSLGWTFAAADHTFDYLAAGESVTITFAVEIADEAGAAATTNVAVTITGADDAPASGDVTAATQQNTRLKVAFAGTDVDEGDTLSYRIVSAPSFGSVANNGDGTFTFDPGHAFDALAAGETQAVALTYQAIDASGVASNVATATVDVLGVNDAPVTVLPAAQTVPTGLATAIAGLATSDVDHGATSSVTLSAAYGQLSATVADGGTIAGAGTSVLTLSGSPGIVSAMLASLTYRSAGNATDTIGVTTSDGLVTVANGSVAITVDPGPSVTSTAPAKVAQGATVAVGTVKAGIPGDTLSLVVMTPPSDGTLSLASGVVSYAATSGKSGADSFTYAVKDQYGDQSAAVTTSLQVDPGPTAASGTITIGHGQAANETAFVNALVTPGLAGDSETIAAVTGRAKLVNGQITYTAPASGADSFGYTVVDQLGETATGTVAVRVDPGPVAATGTLTVGHGTSGDVITLLNGLVTPGLSGDTETISKVTAAHGKPVLSNGRVTYTAPSSGSDTITYTVTDQLGETATSTVAVTVDPGPKLTAAAPTKIAHGASAQVASVAAGLAGDTETLTTTKAGRGSLALSNGAVVYTASATGGSDAISYQIADQYGDVVNGSLSLSVDPGPTAATGKLTLGHGASSNVTALLTGLVKAGLTGDTETLTAVGATRGTASLSNGVVTYTAPASGTDAISYTVTDQLGETASGTVNVTVDPGPTITSTAPAKVAHGGAAQVATVTAGLAGDTETLTITTAGRGTLALANGAITYTAPAAAGSDAIGYKVTDQYGDVATGSFSLSIDPGPTAATGQVTVGHGSSSNVTALLNGLVTAGLAGDTETITKITAANGRTTLSNGVATYVAPASGSDTITYIVTDQLGETATGTVNVTVDPGPSITNTAPAKVAHGGTVQVATVAGGIAGDTETLTTTKAGRGSLTLSNGALVYAAPTTGGSDAISYQIADQYGDVVNGSLSLSVDPGPTAGIGKLIVAHDTSSDVTALVTGLVKAGLTGDTETLTAVGATRGTSSLSNGVVTYTAPASGADAISYTVTDQLGETATGTVNVTVDPGPTLTSTAPAKVAHGGAAQVATVAAGLAGDTETLTITAAGRGTLALANGVIIYTAPAAAGSDAIGYKVTDQYGDVATGSFSLSVDPGPTAATGQVTVGHGSSSNVTALLNGLVTAGLAGDIETITKVTAANGRTTLSNGVATYVAPASGSDTITYVVTDQLGETATNTVGVTIDPGPTTGAYSSTLGLGASADLTTSLIGLATPGLTGDTLTIIGDSTTGTLGSLSLVNGDLVYSATGSGLSHIPANGSQNDSFGYTISDEYGDLATGTAKMVVTNPATTINGPRGGLATIQGTAGADVINASGLGNTIYANGGNDQINAGQGNATVVTAGGDVVTKLSGSSNKVSGGDGWNTVSGSSGTTQVTLGNGNNSVSLGGTGNTITLGSGNDTVTAGKGSDTVTLGAGIDRLILAGTHNSVTLNGSTATVTGAQGNDAIVVNGGKASLSLSGPSSSVTLNGNTVASISDLGNALRINVASSTQTDTITGFGSHDTTGVVALQNGAGGYASVDAVIAALHSDGNGGTALSLGTTGSIDFAGTAASQIHASNFKIG